LNVPPSDDFAARIEQLFTEASSLDPDLRAGFVADACGGDAALRDRVMSLLRASGEADTFWDKPAIQHVATEGLDSDLDRYRLLEPIGAGGMGIVHKAVRADDEYRKVVALKLVLAPDPDLIGRFRRERQLLAVLEHPNIARLLDGGTAKDGSPFLVMEYVDGVPIDKYVHDRNLSTREILLLIRKVCGAVAYAHRNLIIHRDLKPANILVTGEGEPKLLDFGIARLLDDGARRTTAHTAAMTLEYASPEQIRGGGITTATDVHALGLLLYELLSGRRPYENTGNTAALTRAVLMEQPAPMSQRSGRRFDSDLEIIVQMALRKEPERRYSSVEQLSDDIRRYLESYPVLAQPDSRAYRARKFVARNRAAIGATALVLLTVAAGIASTLYEARAANRRFNQVRNLANTYLLEIHDAIKDLPGSTAARQLVVKRALEYLDQLASERGNDAKLACELADGYAKIGDIQNLFAGASLGDVAGAIASHKKAIALLEPFAARNPKDAQVARTLAYSYGALNTMMMRTGDLSAAVSYGRKDAALQERLVSAAPADAKLRELLAISYIRLGDVTGNPNMQNLGDSKGSLSFYRDALSNAEAATAAMPGDWQKAGLVGVVHGRMSQILMSLGDGPGEVAENRKSLEIEERLLAAQPQNTRLQWDVAIAHRNLSLSLLRAGQKVDAREHAEQGLRMCEALVANDPNHVNAQEMIPNEIALLGRIAAESGETARAFQLLRQSIAEFEALRKRGTSPDFTEQNAYNRLADLALDSGDPAEAIRSAQGELAIDEKLLRVNSNNANAKRNRAVATRQIARAHELMALRRSSADELRKAVSLYRDSLEILQEMHAAGTLAPVYQKELSGVSDALERCDRELHALR
jgi:non-specific serine/threonine protein kinase/serine/threonine-protein kinase